MVITVRVELGKDQTLLYTPDAAATQVIAALGANPTVDYCEVTVVASPMPGAAGTPPPPPEPFLVQPTTPTAELAAAAAPTKKRGS